MQYQPKAILEQTINQLAAAATPLLFLIDFKGEQGIALPLKELAAHGISCQLNGKSYGATDLPPLQPQQVAAKPMPFATYEAAFNLVKSEIERGNSYLLNLTYPTPLGNSLHLPTIYQCAKAPYKFLLREAFTFYSPEPFVRIEDNRIYSFPMKGTVSGTVANGRRELLENEKELFEHYTVVDLIRNDLAMVAEHVTVEEFRYVEELHTAKGPILQTSSKIAGLLPAHWKEQLGTILLTLLPAGSVSGAPKPKTVAIIEEYELDARGFYCGIMGVFDGERVESCVNIRFVEQTPQGEYRYRSGGGITSRSTAQEEYDELLTKVYVPLS